MLHKHSHLKHEAVKLVELDIAGVLKSKVLFEFSFFMTVRFKWSLLSRLDSSVLQLVFKKELNVFKVFYEVTICQIYKAVYVLLCETGCENSSYV